MTDVMIDLETLGTGCDAVILQVGAVDFDPDARTAGEPRRWTVSIESCLARGLRIDGSTLEWWLDHPEAFRKIHEARPQPLDEVLAELAESYDWKAIENVWARGPSFDLAILRHAYRVARVATSTPWRFRRERDVRTLLDAAERFGYSMIYPTRIGVDHDAGDDAVHQARCVIAAYEALRDGRGRDE